MGDGGQVLGSFDGFAHGPTLDGNSKEDGKDDVWLSLCHNLLFLTSHPSSDEAPYAFVYLHSVLVEHTQLDRCSLTLVGNPKASRGQVQGAQEEILDGEDALDGCEGITREVDMAKTTVVSIVFLLPDGRWQECDLPKLEVQVGNQQLFERWVRHLQAVCGEGHGL